MTVDIKEVRKIIKIMEEKDLVEFSYEEGEKKIHLKRKQEFINQPYIPSILKMSEEKPVEKTIKESQNVFSISSPMVGTFYRAPSPDANPFVEVGDIVEEGKVICIIEAMKLMNEIKADKKGKVVKILVENGTAIEYGQELFILEPIE